MNNLKEKKLNNSGFSLVELIIVIAIMAVLIGVLAPQYMRYVEKSRLATDNDSIDSLKTAVEVALTDETIWKEVQTAVASGAVEIELTTSSYSIPSSCSTLETEVKKVVTSFQLTSNTYKNAITNSNAPILKISLEDSTIKVETGGGYTTTAS